ncbi:MAG: glycosyl transferase family 1 [Desulfovibrio sp.]|nr:glycosyl transferase family 1 [Desulfovibrio sp.]
MPKPIYVMISLDVEEEGLFTGLYPRKATGVRNVAWLRGLEPLLARGVKPTLFCAHSVFTDRSAWPVLEDLRDHHGAEIGAHLHYWNTPPLPPGPDVLDAVPTCELDQGLFAAKLESLFKAGRDFQGADIKAFRMGRWDIHKKHWPLLFEAGVEADASVRPLYGMKTPREGADHFSAPNQPYWMEHGGRRMFEAPLTVVPLSRLAANLHMLPQNALGKKARAFMRHWNTMALLPAYHPLWSLKLASRLCLSRGNALVMTWHSSEMMPGGAPHMPDKAAVDGMLARIGAWIDWLRKHWDVRFVTLPELAAVWKEKNHEPLPPGEGDWRP